MQLVNFIEINQIEQFSKFNSKYDVHTALYVTHMYIKSNKMVIIANVFIPTIFHVTVNIN